MSLSIAQIGLAILGGVGERRTKVKDLYTKERQRQRDYWDVNGSKISNQMNTNKTLALNAATGLLDANLSPENLTELLNNHGVEEAIILNTKLQKLREEDPAKYNDLINDGLDVDGGNMFTGGLNSLTKLQDKSDGDIDAWKEYINTQFAVKEFSPREKEGGKNIFNSITDRLTGRDLEDEHDRFMDEELIGDKTIRQLKELRDRGPEQGKIGITYDDIQRITPSDFGTAARGRAGIRRDNILADALTGLASMQNSAQLEDFVLKGGRGGSIVSSEAQISLLKKGNITGDAVLLHPEYFFDVLRKEQEDNGDFTDADALTLGFSSRSDLLNAIRPRVEKAIEEDPDVSLQDTNPEDVVQVDNMEGAKVYKKANPNFTGLYYIKDTHKLYEFNITDTPPGPTPVPEVGEDPVEVSMVPDASNVVAIPLPTDSINEKKEWQKKYKGKYEQDGTPIVVPKRPTTEAEQAILIKTFGFDEYKGSALAGSRGKKAPTLEQTQKEWDEKYKNSHDPSGYPLGYTLKTS